MSTKNVTKRDEAVSGSAELQAKAESIHVTAARDATGENAAQASQTTDTVTADDFLPDTPINQRELSDEQLETVAGGGSDYGAIYINTHFGCGNLPTDFGSEKGRELADRLRKDGRS